MNRDLRNIISICPNCFHTLDKYGFCAMCRTKLSDMVNNSSLALAPRTVLAGRYLVGKKLGAGGFGITYLAWDMLTSTRVCVKEFFPKGYTTRLSKSKSVTVIERSFAPTFQHWLNAFVHEAKILTSITHLHGVVKLLNFFQENETAYIVMDYLEGVSMRKYLNLRNGKIMLNEMLSIMRPVMDSLLLLHQYGIIHKDISPENIIVVQNKYVKLIDFGAASIFTQNIIKPFIVLKAGYSPIELYSTALKQGPWSDIYQVGATIYNCITGIIPPEAPQRLKKDLIVRPSQLGVQLPLVVENCLMCALSIQPSARYNNMGKFIQTLYGEFLPKPTIFQAKS